MREVTYRRLGCGPWLRNRRERRGGSRAQDTGRRGPVLVSVRRPDGGPTPADDEGSLIGWGDRPCGLTRRIERRPGRGTAQGRVVDGRARLLPPPALAQGARVHRGEPDLRDQARH